MMYGHPYAPLLLALTQVEEDPEMIEGLDMELDGEGKEKVHELVLAFEACCDVSFRDRKD